jgi:hypothetical protein
VPVVADSAPVELMSGQQNMMNPYAGKAIFINLSFYWQKLQSHEK